MKNNAHLIILTLNRLLLIHTDRERSNKKHIAKPCIRKVSKILNSNLDLFEGIWADTFDATALMGLETEGFECLIKFYPHQSFPLVHAVGSLLFQGSALVTDLTKRVVILEKANQLFDAIYVLFSKGDVHSNTSFLNQYGKAKISLAKALSSLGFEDDAQQLKTRAKVIMRMASSTALMKELELEVDTYIEAA